MSLKADDLEQNSIFVRISQMALLIEKSKSARLAQTCVETKRENHENRKNPKMAKGPSHVIRFYPQLTEPIEYAARLKRCFFRNSKRDFS